VFCPELDEKNFSDGESWAMKTILYQLLKSYFSTPPRLFSLMVRFLLRRIKLAKTT
jgi:hypothetical protein